MTSPLTAVGEERLRECPFCGEAAVSYDTTIRCPNKNCWGPYVDQFSSMDDARAAWNRRSPVPEGDGLQVKALEWVKRSGVPGVWDAMSAVGFYRLDDAFQVQHSAGLKLVLPSWRSPFHNASEQCVSLDEAKAAAQADYTARILSALASPAPVKAEAEVVAVRWQREMMKRQGNRDLPDFSLPASAFPDYRTGGGGTLASTQKCIRQDCDCFDSWSCSRPAIATPSSGGRREALKEDGFDKWWAEDGQYIDPDTSDVPWFDKRRGVAEAAFHAGRKS